MKALIDLIIDYVTWNFMMLFLFKFCDAKLF